MGLGSRIRAFGQYFTKVRIELMVMMFLQFFVWGAWFVTLSIYIKTRGFNEYLGWAYSTTNWAAIVSPFFIGMVADRFFPAQKVLGVMHLLGAALMVAAARAVSAQAFVGLLLAYALTYMPTLALVNAVAFNQMTNIDKEFPPIRTLGTIGWIVAGLLISLFGLSETATPMYMAAAAAAVLGVYSFFLPATPPRSAGKKASVRDVLGLDALKLFKTPSFAVFMAASLLVCIPLSFYYAGGAQFLKDLGVANETAKLTMGQMSEVFFLLIMPVFLLRLGVKKMLLIGMAAWAGRYFLWAYGDNQSLAFMLYIGILLHGVCYDFFFVTGQLYMDRTAPQALRASAQGLYGFLTYGVGMVIGSLIAGRVVNLYTAEGVTVWHYVWLLPAVAVVVLMIAFVLSFREKAVPAAEKRLVVAKAEE